MITIQNLHKEYNNKIVLQNVSFKAKKGEITGLIGPNGSGKSTLIRILLGLENSQMGMALIDGKKYSQLGDNPFGIVGSFLDSCQPYPTRTGFQHLRWIGLATALLASPDILILDEPINGLDPEGIRWVRNFLQSFVNEGKTVLMTSHYMSELELTVDHLVGISNGKIVLDAPTKDILKQFGSFEEAYFKALEGKEGE